MAFLKDLHLFSEVNGVVLLDGKPVEGVEVVQEYFWHWGDKKGRTVVKSDALGRFHFPLITGKSITAGLLPHEPVTDQKINFYYQGREIKGWSHSNHNYEPLAEIGRPLDLICDLRDEPSAQLDIRSYGICVPKTQ